jgi:hypothetical protein
MQLSIHRSSYMSLMNFNDSEAGMEIITDVTGNLSRYNLKTDLTSLGIEEYLTCMEHACQFSQNNFNVSSVKVKAS